MITRTLALAAFIATCTFSLPASAASLSDCTPGQSAKPGLLAKAWRDFQSALVLSKPTEAQRLVDLRLSLQQLVVKKKSLVSTVDDVVKQGSVPGWLETRVKEIPALQEDIGQLMSNIEEEARTGGLLGSSASLSALMQVLSAKREVTLCELASIPFPLPSEKLAMVKTLLKDLQEEVGALEGLDASLAKLIKDAHPHP